MPIQETEPAQRETGCTFICRPNGKRWTVLWYVVLWTLHFFLSEKALYLFRYDEIANEKLGSHKAQGKDQGADEAINQVRQTHEDRHDDHGNSERCLAGCAPFGSRTAH
jgi:hypothetical protein